MRVYLEILSCPRGVEMMSTQVAAINRNLYYVFFGTAFIGPALFVLPLESFSVFPSRVMLLVAWASFLACALYQRYFPWKSVRLLLFGLVAWAVLSLLWNPSPGQGFGHLLSLFMGVSLVFLAPMNTNGLKTLTKVWAVFFLLFVALGLFEHITTWHLPISRFFDNPDLAHVNYRPTAVFHNENEFASFLALSFPLAISFILYAKKLAWRVAMGAGFVLGIYLLFVFPSRINHIALAATVILFPLLMVQRGRKLKVFILLTSTILLIFFFMGTLQPALQGALIDSTGSLFRFPGQVFDDAERISPGDSLAVRVNLLRNGAVFIRNFRGLGSGVGSFEHLVSTTAPYDTRGSVNPHNWWVELFVEYGVAALFYLGFLAFLYIRLFHMWKAKQNMIYVSWIGTSLLLLPIVAVSPSRFVAFAPHWLLLSVAAVLVSKPREGEETCA